jgi:hypothetical protein
MALASARAGSGGVDEGLSKDQGILVAAAVGGGLVLVGLWTLVALRRRSARRELEGRVASASAQAKAAQEAHEQSRRELEQTRRQAAAAEEDSKRAIEGAEAAQEAVQQAIQEASERREPAAAPPVRRRQTMFHEPGGASSSSDTFRLVAVGEGAPGLAVDLFSPGSPSTVRLGNDPDRCSVTVSHETISGLHASFTRASDGTVLVEDLGSANGTYVEGTDIRGRGAVTVHVGHRVQLGLFKTVLQDH